MGLDDQPAIGRASGESRASVGRASGESRADLGGLGWPMGGPLGLNNPNAPLRVCGDYWLLQAKPEVAGADIGDCFEADAHF